MQNLQILEHLEKIVILQSIAKHGSLHKAALELNISQPSLSVKVQTLEQALKIQLFHRSSKGTRLTEEGHKVHEYAQNIIQLTNQLQNDLTTKKQGLHGVLRLGIYESIAQYFWPSFYKYFKEKFPFVKIQVSVGRSMSLVQKVLDNSIDAAMTVEPIAHQHLESINLYHDSFGFYIHENNIKKNSKMDIDALREHQLFIFSNALTDQGKPLSERLAQLRVPTEQINEVESFEVAAEFCSQQMGISVLPTLVASHHHLKGKLKLIKFGNTKQDLFSKHQISLTVPQKMIQHSLYEVLINEIKNYNFKR